MALPGAGCRARATRLKRHRTTFGRHWSFSFRNSLTRGGNATFPRGDFCNQRRGCSWVGWGFFPEKKSALFYLGMDLLRCANGVATWSCRSGCQVQLLPCRCPAIRSFAWARFSRLFANPAFPEAHLRYESRNPPMSASPPGIFSSRSDCRFHPNRSFE